MKFLISQLQKLKNKVKDLPQKKLKFDDFLKLIKEPILYEISEHKLQMVFDLLKDNTNQIDKDQYDEICEMCFEQLLEDLDDEKMDFDKAIKIIENFKCLVAENNLQNTQKVKKSFFYQFFLQGEYQQKVFCLVLLNQHFPNSFQFGDIKKQIQMWEEDVLYNNKYFKVKHINLKDQRSSNQGSNLSQQECNTELKSDLMISIQNILDEKNINFDQNDQWRLQQDLEKLYIEKECSPQCLQNKIEIQQDLNYYKNLIDTQDNKIQNYEKKTAEKNQLLQQYSLEIIELKKKFQSSIKNLMLSQKDLKLKSINNNNQQQLGNYTEEQYLDVKNQLQLQLNKNRDLLEQIQDLKLNMSEIQVQNVQLNSEKQQFLSQVQIQPIRDRTQSISTIQNLLLKTQSTLDEVTEKYNKKDKENITLKKRIKENEDIIFNMQQKLVDQLIKQSEQDPNQIQLQEKQKYQGQINEFKTKIQTQSQTIKILEKKLETIKQQKVLTTQNTLQIQNEDDKLHVPEISLKKNTFLQKLEQNYKIEDVNQEQKQLEQNLKNQLGLKKNKKIKQKVTRILGLPNEQKLDTKKYSYDYLDINNNKQILALIRNFQPFKKNTKCFSSIIQRVNSWNKKTKKWLVITNKYIYIFSPPNKIKNIINMNEIQCAKHSKVNNYVGIQHIKLEDEIFEIFKKTEFLLYLRKKILRKKQEFILKEEKSFTKYSRMNNKNQFIPEDFDCLKPNYNKTFLDASNNEDIYNVKIPIKNFLCIEYESDALMLILNYGLVFFDPASYQQIDFYPMIGIFLSRSIFSDKQISLLFCNNDQKFINFLNKKEREKCYQKFIQKFVQKNQNKS